MEWPCSDHLSKRCWREALITWSVLMAQITRHLIMGSQKEYILSSGSDSEAGATDEDNTEDRSNLGEEVASWATRNKCTRTSLNELLDILRRHAWTPPPERCTYFITDTENSAVSRQVWRKICVLWYRDGNLKDSGTVSSIVNSLDCIDLRVNINGVPVFKSSSVDLWPSLCRFSTENPDSRGVLVK